MCNIPKEIFPMSYCGLVTKLYSTLATPWTAACQAPLSMGFPRQECWRGLSFPPPGFRLHPGVEPGVPAMQADSLPTQLPGKPSDLYHASNVHSSYNFKMHYVTDNINSMWKNFHGIEVNWNQFNVNGSWFALLNQPRWNLKVLYHEC